MSIDCCKSVVPVGEASRRSGLPLLLACSLLLGLASAPSASGAGPEDYRLVQLTVGVLDDVLPRVSSGTPAILVWASRKGLTGSVSSGTDKEIVLWDGRMLEQITDDGADDTRPVVNNLRQVAWQKGQGEPETDIYVRYFETGTGWIEERVTTDRVRRSDRYPDINDDGFVTWGRWNGEFHSFASYRIGGPDEFLWLPDLKSYRPHINASSEITFAGRWIRNPQGELLGSLSAEDFGFESFWRAEINDGGQILIEAVRDELEGDKRGPREMIFWDGTQMKQILASPVWIGRGDLNNSGVAVFEGLGGLAGSTSGGGDREIFVYRDDTGELFQLTDNDVEDEWATITNDGTIIWQTKGIYVGAEEGRFTGVVDPQCCDDIMMALPLTRDYDHDGVPNAGDNCPVTYNLGQADGDEDGVGDACAGSCQGFTQVADCSQTLVNEGIRKDTSGCSSGGTMAVLLLPLVLLAVREPSLRAARAVLPPTDA